MKKYQEVWHRDKIHGDISYERAIGIKDEMESSKALCKILKPIYKNGMKTLDVGCGSGHYLRSLQTRLDKDIDYTGIDIAKYYVDCAKKAFKDTPFYVGDIYNIQFDDGTFDIVTANNIIHHLPPPPIIPIEELLRVSKQYIIIRIPTSNSRNYIIKEIADRKDDFGENYKFPEEHNLIKLDGEPFAWNYFNLYTTTYLKNIIHKLDENTSIKIIDDIFWDNLDDPMDTLTATKIIDNKQVSGNIILDWKFVVIKKHGDNSDNTCT